MHPAADACRPQVPNIQAFYLNGTQALYDLLECSQYGSVTQAVASLTAFTHPQTVASTRTMNLFVTIRNFAGRGLITDHPTCGRVMQDDNYSPTAAFLWANGIRPSRGATIKSYLGDVQFNHIWTRSQDVHAYTSLANLCMTPSFLAKLTDTDHEIRNLLRFRAYDLYSYVPKDEPIPAKPDDYDALQWCPPVPAVPDVEQAFRQAMRTKPQDRITRSARELGWYFSHYQPDTTL
ncbi:MAG TPA: hypothetical protein VGM51_11440 [Armatimonadota bacterium]|jgi:hypothetical protein